nr:hypothetical protein [Tanacetum cinerariifolium]
MRTRSSSNLVGESSPNPTYSNPKRCNRRRSKQPFILEESPVDTMVDQRTMAELLRALIEGYVEAIVVLRILAEQFELKHSLINMMTSDQFFVLEKDNPHDHIRAARRWLKKEPPRSILTWEDLAWDRYKDLFYACAHHGFTKLHKFDTFYNALNPTDQDSLNSATDGNLLERRTQDVLTINENKSKVCNFRNKSIVSQVKSSDANSSCSSELAKLTHAVNQQTSAVTTTMIAILKQFQATSPPPSVKAVKEICVTYGDVICIISVSPPMATLSWNFEIIFKDTFQQPQLTTIMEKIQMINEINIKAMETQINNLQNELRNEMKTSIQASMSNQTNELKNMMARFSQMNTASTSGSGPLPSNTIANLKGDFNGPGTRDHLHPNIPYPSRMHKQKQQDKDEIQIHKFWQIFKQLHINITLDDALILIPKYHKMLKALLFNKEKLLELANTPLNENCSAVILKKLPEKLEDPSKFLILCGFSELKCKALADLGASINLMPLSLELQEMSLFRLASSHSPLIFSLLIMRAILKSPSFWEDLFARALIDVHGEEMILRDGDERLTLNMRYDTSSYSNQPQKELINMINIYDDSCEEYLEDLFATNHLSGNPMFSSHTDLTSPKVINPLSGSTSSSSSNHLLEDFADELALITFPVGNDDLPFDIKSDLREIEYFLNHDPTKEMDSILEDSVDECNLANPNDNLVDTIPYMFTDEHILDYSSPLLYDDYDDLDEFESDTVDVYDELFDSKGEKIKESKLLIDELDLPRSSDFLFSPEYDSFLFENFSKVDAFPSTDNEDKIFNSGILIQENLSEVTVQVTPDKNVKNISNASLILEDFNPPLYELPFHKEVLEFETLLSFSSKNEEKVFKPGILTSKGVHTSLLLELSHRGPKAFKTIKILESPMEIFPCSFGEDICILDVPCLHFCPP